MFYTLCGVTDFRMPEISLHLLRLALGAPQVTSHIPDHLRLVAWTPAPNCVGLDILVEQLVRVEIRAVAGKEKEVNLPSVASQPSLDTAGCMNWMLVDNEKDFAPSMTNKTLQEQDKHEYREILVENHECQFSAIGNRRNQVATEALSSSWNDRCFSSSSVGGASLMVGPHPHLVAPVDRCSLSPCVGSDGWILLPQPLPHCPRIPLVGTPQGFLWSETPAFEVSPYRPNRKPNAKSASDQISYCFAGPECKRQLELVRTTVGNHTHDCSSLQGSQPDLRRTTSGARPKRSHSIFPPVTVPTIDGLPGNPKNFCRLRLRHPLADGTDYALTKNLLCHRRQTTGILTFHFA